MERHSEDEARLLSETYERKWTEVGTQEISDKENARVSFFFVVGLVCFLFPLPQSSG